MIKVYEKTEKYPGEKVSQYLNSLKVGAFVQFSKPFGKLIYLGNGRFKLFDKVRKKTKLGLIAGGTGITPIF